MKIQILGSGCPTCHKLHELVKSLVEEVGRGDEVNYVTGDDGMQAILELGAMSSPLLVVDGKIVMVGFTTDKNKVKAKIYGHI